MLITKKIGKTALFYVVSFLLLYLLSIADHGGPCSPPLFIILGLLIFIPACVFLFAYNFYQTVVKGKEYLLSAILHGLVIATLCVGVAIG
jgi:hypothetical protein